MAVTDPVADMLTRIRNAAGVLHKDVSIPRSNLKEAVASILKEQGYIVDYAVSEREITVDLKYVKGKSIFSGLKRISKPGRRIYVGAEDIPRVQNGLGICIVSTSKGLLDGESARESKVGGELMCEIW